MPAQLEELVATFRGERMRWDETVLAHIELPGAAAATSIDDLFDVGPNLTTIKGPAETDELQYGLAYRFYGKWETYKSKSSGVDERQFHFHTFVRVQPHGRGGTIRYLMSSPGIGQKTAEVLWEKFNGRAVEILRQTPEVAVAAVGLSHFTIERATEAAEFLRDEQSMEGCTIDLLDVLSGRGFPKSVAKKAVRKWGNKAAEVIRRCPYRLMAFRGVGFLKTDAMYMDLGLPPAKIKRQAYCAWHAVASDTEGHTWYPVSVIEKGIRQKVGGTAACPPAALKLAKRGKLLATRRDSRAMLWVADARKAAAEAKLAEFVAAALLERHDEWPGSSEIDGLSEHQGETLGNALTSKLAILCGSPGTGKTYTAAALIRAICRLCGGGQVAVAAPTGKAAVRISEALARYGIGLRATTIHSLLGVRSSDEASKSRDSDSWSFSHHEDNPLPYRFIVIDEGSMVDTSLMCSLFAARAVGTHILIVGDTNQLSPVGHGAPLRDFIAAGVPCGELTEIWRNSGSIIKACQSIRFHNRFEAAPRIDLAAEDPQNLYVVRAGKPEEQVDRMLAGIGAAKATGLDPVWDVQILVPVNEKSPLARKALNERLQRELNADGEAASGNPFRVRDKIVCLKNGWLMLEESFLEGVRDRPIVDSSGDMTTYELENGDHLPVTEAGQVYVANGELAAVSSVTGKLTTANLTSPQRVVCIPRGGKKDKEAEGEESSEGQKSAGCQWDLGYALSTHKSQGSEWPVVIVMLDEYAGARRVCSREWIYTAISRAKKLCLLVGKKHTGDAMCRREALSRRKTFLVEQIAEQLVQQRVEELVA
jgi:exodeoxyribonuclease V alpha subunit